MSRGAESPLRLLSAYENKQLALALIAAAPPCALSLYLLAASGVSAYAVTLLGLAMLLLLGYCAMSIRHRAVHALRTVSNLLETMIHGDYSLRGRHLRDGDALGDVFRLLNRLAERLADQALQARESHLLIRIMTDQIDVAIIAADDHGRIAFVNPAATKLLARPREEVLGRSLAHFGLDQLLEVDERRLAQLKLGARQGKFYVYSDVYMEQGRQHKLLFITDVQRLLQEEERQAWQSLLRVLGHEINNSLSPIASISETLGEMVRDHPEGLSADSCEALSEGMTVIKERASSLGSFLGSYGRLAKLAAPVKEPFSLSGLLADLVPLFHPRPITVTAVKDVTLFADRAQMQQVLLNVLKNADEAMPEASDSITVSWDTEPEMLHVRIADQGTGISNPDNLFVPLYSTKPNGSGIGLALSRQIVFNHNGRLSLENRADGPGARVTIALPYIEAASDPAA